MRRAAAALVLMLAAAAAVQAADAPAVVTGAEPARAGDLLVARLRTAGLPGDRLLQSMRSGLVSAVEFDVVLLDEREDAVAGSRVLLLLGFDLWEEIWSVRTDGQEHRFGTLDELRGYLADLRAVPVAPASLVAPEAGYRLRVELQTHPIAPDEQARVEDAIAGVQRPRREGLDQQEAQVSLGRLIQLFYKGGGRSAGGRAFVSPWFRGREVDRAQD